jgi:glycerol-1-phosphate dehydrogenase [NAD(P)+]
MLPTPLHIDVRRDAIADLMSLLGDRRISNHGHIAVTIGPGLGDEVLALLGDHVHPSDVFTVADDSIDTATDLADAVRRRPVDVLVGIGGGRTLDVAKYAATRAGLPMVAVATSLAHDGLASPVSVLSVGGSRGSFGVATPIAVVVDLAFVARSPEHFLRAGIGDLVSNLSAVADWHLGNRVNGEPVDGLALALATSSAEAVVERRDPTRSEPFLVSLAQSLVLSGLAMSVAGTSRPCSGACHEISHSIDRLFPGRSSHGEQVAVGALFATVPRGDEAEARRIAGFFAHLGVAMSPAQLGLREDEFVKAVLEAPGTRPDRFTILEHLGLGEAALFDHLERMADLVGGSYLGVTVPAARMSAMAADAPPA